MLLVIDHRDSFTWNLVHTLGRFAHDVVVRESEELSVAVVRALKPRGIVFSPGPGRPEEARVSLRVVEALAGDVPMLGVCLGHQLICSAFAARVVHAAEVCHGRASSIHHDGSGLFDGIPSPFRAARYHSLVVDRETLPRELHAQAHSESGELMAVRHAALPIAGVQFHPESFLTEHGARLVQNFVTSLVDDSLLEGSAARFSA